MCVVVTGDGVNRPHLFTHLDLEEAEGDIEEEIEEVLDPVYVHVEVSLPTVEEDVSGCNSFNHHPLFVSTQDQVEILKGKQERQ